MDQGSYSFLPISSQQSSNMAEQQLKHLCRLLPCHVPGNNIVEHYESFLFFSVQCHLFYYRVTFSLNN